MQLLDRETMPLTLEMVLLLRDELWLDFTTIWPWNQTLIDQHIADNMSYLGVANGFEGGNRSQHTVLTKVQATDRVSLLRDVTITVGVGHLNVEGVWSDGTRILRGEEIRSFVLNKWQEDGRTLILVLSVFFAITKSGKPVEIPPPLSSPVARKRKRSWFGILASLLQSAEP